MDLLQPARGTRDLVGEEQRRHAHVIATARRIAGLYGYDEWSTPIFEDTRVFSRSLGETSDVVSKEMYSFIDRGGDSVTLRPEGTASICRALVTNGLTQSLPQKGRYRQFHQIGAELIGPGEPFADAETIALGRHILSELGIEDGVVLELNTLGDADSRAAWREALVGYFREVREGLSEESRNRLERNPLRILDSKSAADQALVAEAPLIEPFLSAAARDFWDALRSALDLFHVPFRHNPRIVRGLDYYSHTAFEFVTDRLGAQGTVLAGGRYDGLVADMGGPQTPAIGWAAGVERLSMLLDAAPPTPVGVAVVPVGEAAQPIATRLLQALRDAGIRTEIGYRGNLKRRMERANKTGAGFAVIVGEDEASRGVVQLRNLVAGNQDEVPIAELVRRLGAATDPKIVA